MSWIKSRRPVYDTPITLGPTSTVGEALALLTKRAHGIVVVRESALDGHTDPVGEYAGHAIWGSVTFLGMVYRFDHVIPARDKEKTGPGELYLDPGLVYVAI